MRSYRSVVALALLLLAILTFTGFVQAQTASTQSAILGAHNVGPTQAKDEQATAFARELRAQLSGQVSTSSSYSSYTKVSDDLGQITMEIPTVWRDIDMGPWLYQGKEVGMLLAASADLQNFYTTKSEPGVFIGVSHQLAQMYDPESLLNLEKGVFSKKCKPKERKDYQDLFYTGRYDTYIECVKGNHNLLVAVATTPDRRVLILLRITVVSDADLEAAARIFQTFQSPGAPQSDDDHDEH